MNSRPLYPLSSDPIDLNPLTPGHFIIGGPMVAVPQDDSTELQGSHVCRFRYLQSLTQQFWKLWSRDYLHHLQQGNEWQFNKNVSGLKGALVLLKEENLPPQRWSLGRIIDVHPGSDGVVRVVSIKTATSVIKRATTKIAILPTE